MKYRGFTSVELVAIIATLSIMSLILLPALSHARDAGRRASCAGNLKQIGLSLKMYANEANGGFYPQMKVLDCEGNRKPWTGVFDTEAMFPEYMNDWNSLMCPSANGGTTALEQWDEGNTLSGYWDSSPGYSRNGTVEPCEVVGHPFAYIGWLIDDETLQLEASGETGNQILRAHDSLRTDSLNRFENAISDLAAKIVGDPRTVFKDWELPEPIGGRESFPRIREGMERFFITDVKSPSGTAHARSSLAVMWDMIPDSTVPFNHTPGGANILFLDGHVEFRRVPNSEGLEFPTDELGMIMHTAFAGHPQERGPRGY